jgi:hypothetical protein
MESRSHARRLRRSRSRPDATSHDAKATPGASELQLGGAGIRGHQGSFCVAGTGLDRQAGQQDLYVLGY